MRASFFLVLLALFAVVALGQNTTTTGSGTVPPTAKPTNAPATPAPTVPGTPTTAPTVKPTGAPATPAPTVPGTPTTAPTTTPTVKPTTPANPATPAPTAAPAFANITLTATIDIVGPLSAVNVTGIEAAFAAVVGVPASQVDVSFRANSRRAVLAAYTMIVNIIQRVQAGVLPATVATNIQNQVKDALANPSNPLTTTLATAGNVSVSSIATTAVVNNPTVLPTARPTPNPAATTSGAGKLALSFASVLSFVFVFAL